MSKKRRYQGGDGLSTTYDPWNDSHTFSYDWGSPQEVSSSVGGWLSRLWNGIKNWFKGKTGSGMTDADKEASELSLRNQQILNEQEYDRKIDFYNRFESPLAQVTQYKNAGLNPMLLGSSGASMSASGGIGSAGSAPADNSASLGSMLDVLGTLLNFKLQSRRLDIEERAVQLDADRNPSVISRNLGSAEVSYASAEEKRALVEKKAAQLDAQTEVFKDSLNTAKVERELKRAQISKAEADAALSIRQEALLAIQEKYSDKYWENTLDIQESQKALNAAATAKNYVECRYLEQQIENLQTENDNMLKEGIGIVLENGKLAHEFSIIGKEDANADKRIKQENAARVVGMVTDCVDSAVGVVGAASGVGMVGASISRASSYRRQTDYNVNRPYYRQR